MKKINREDIYMTSKHSDLSKEEIGYLLEQNSYADKKDWQKFINLFVLTLGIGFVTTGIVFFFAYNWAELNKFLKIGIIGILLIATTAGSLLVKKEVYKNLILTAAAMLVGVLFAVFGQIYQTGANAYDFFLAWTLFITLWVIIANFYPLWLLYLLLINTTIVLYNEQVLTNLNDVGIVTLLFFINGLTLILLLLINERRKTLIPLWFRNTLALAVTTMSTLGICYFIFDDYTISGILLIIGTLCYYLYAIKYALSNKSIFLIASVSFSVMIIFCALLIKAFEDEAVLFIISLFVLVAVTAIIKLLLNLQKKWNNEISISTPPTNHDVY
ncbi:DUF2157 domain-containing protein [Sphingobacterium sp. SRCM116780]|uniref:DUF2157 domain-containing protein n=1 Tax=Sphingobacterium sp. SRCM116780 TaxID=2907623 RepID=UPI001F23D563|nr:DUF2157 domain-containing protein [Sphingobacterium sp. SRCM116780]UIR55036.1 DUF2157 domain-containing protein [Sphingobacterium sp. SRCM116780]